MSVRCFDAFANASRAFQRRLISAAQMSVVGSFNADITACWALAWA